MRVRINGQDFAATSRNPPEPGTTGKAVVEAAGPPLRIRITDLSLPASASVPASSKIPVLLGREPIRGNIPPAALEQLNRNLAAALEPGQVPSPLFLREAIVLSRFLASTLVSLPGFKPSGPGRTQAGTPLPEKASQGADGRAPVESGSREAVAVRPLPAAPGGSVPLSSAKGGGVAASNGLPARSEAGRLLPDPQPLALPRGTEARNALSLPAGSPNRSPLSIMNQTDAIRSTPSAQPVSVQPGSVTPVSARLPSGSQPAQGGQAPGVPVTPPGPTRAPVVVHPSGPAGAPAAVPSPVPSGAPVAVQSSGASVAPVAVQSSGASVAPVAVPSPVPSGAPVAAQSPGASGAPVAVQPSGPPVMPIAVQPSAPAGTPAVAGSEGEPRRDAITEPGPRHAAEGRSAQGNPDPEPRLPDGGRVPPRDLAALYTAHARPTPRPPASPPHGEARPGASGDEHPIFSRPQTGSNPARPAQVPGLPPSGETAPPAPGRPSDSGAATTPRTDLQASVAPAPPTTVPSAAFRGAGMKEPPAGSPEASQPVRSDPLSASPAGEAPEPPRFELHSAALPGQDAPFWFFVPFPGEKAPLLFPGYREPARGESEASWRLFFRLPEIGAISIRFQPGAGGWSILFEVEHPGMCNQLEAGASGFSAALRDGGFPLREVRVRPARRGSAESEFGAMLSRDTGLQLLEERA